MNWLEGLSPDLASKLQRASAAKQQAASLAAAEFAITAAKVVHPLVDHALEELRKGNILSAKERAELVALVTQFDENYLAFLDPDDEPVNTDGFYRWFIQARAVAALSYAGAVAAMCLAGNEDSYLAATDAIYEAAASTDYNQELAAVVQSALQ
jgi:hypothetical protein